MYNTQPDDAMLPVDAPLVDNRSGIVEAFVSSFSMIIVSELGDKTFFIAAILAMKHARLTIFLSAIAALIVMTLLSVILGGFIPTLIRREHTAFIATILFMFFGIHLLLTAYVDEEGSDELEEVEESLQHLDKSVAGAGHMAYQAVPTSDSDDNEDHDIESQSVPAAGEKDMFPTDLSARSSPPAQAQEIPSIFLQCFTLTFLAEWGDRSQISTIVMSASKNAIGVCLGGFIGHAICTGLAVLGGRYLAERISERMVNLCGGICFIIFSLLGFYTGFK